MFQELNNCLFQYKTVCIPGIGTFKIVQQPAVLDVANQQLLPPQVQVLFSQTADMPPHQLRLLAPAFDNDIQAAEQALVDFGVTFKYSLQQQPFAWQGIGELAFWDSNIQFKQQAGVLSAVPAQKVLREGVQHSVLVGDTEMQLSAELPAEEEVLKSRSVTMIIAWVILVLAAAFIIYHVYTHQGKVAATGLQQKAIIQTTPPQHK